MTQLEVLGLVRREVLSIQKRDGTLQKSAYVWAEVVTRLGTLKPWEGMNACQTVGRALRPLVEAVVASLVAPVAPVEDVVNLRHLAPLDAAKAYGTKRHRHLLRTPA